VTLNVSDISDDEEFDRVMDVLEKHNSSRTFPMLFINQTYVGDYSYVQNMHNMGLFNKYIEGTLGVLIEDDF